MKIEQWNGYNIRFVKHNDEWWAIAKDITDALGYSNNRDALQRHCDGVAKHDGIDSIGRTQTYSIIGELDIYSLIFGSALPEAEDFKVWAFNTIKSLRQASGLEGFQIFTMLDKEHQKAMMQRLHDGLDATSSISYIKANTIANKATSMLYGFDKSIKKEDMDADMLKDREDILKYTVDTMVANDELELGLSVSNQVYKHFNVD